MEIPSYGLPPKVITSQMVTPKTEGQKEIEMKQREYKWGKRRELSNRKRTYVKREKDKRRKDNVTMNKYRED